MPKPVDEPTRLKVVPWAEQALPAPLMVPAVAPAHALMT